MFSSTISSQVFRVGTTKAADVGVWAGASNGTGGSTTALRVIDDTGKRVFPTEVVLDEAFRDGSFAFTQAVFSRIVRHILMKHGALGDNSVDLSDTETEILGEIANRAVANHKRKVSLDDHGDEHSKRMRTSVRFSVICLFYIILILSPQMMQALERDRLAIQADKVSHPCNIFARPQE